MLSISRMSLIRISSRCLASPSTKVLPVKEDKSFVDTDGEKIASHACISFYVQDEGPGPKLKANSEYPEWLFKLDVSAPKELEELDAEKDGWKYWRALRKRQVDQNRRIKQLSTSFLHVQNSPSLRQKK